VFYAINGFDYNGEKWFAAPNCNLFTWINPETSTHRVWRHNGQKRTFYKNDLESRLTFAGMQWSFNSLSMFNACLEHELKGVRYPVDIPAYVLVATNDGYWYGRPRSDIDDLLDIYLSNKEVLYRHESHLWVLMPNNVVDLLSLVHRCSFRSSASY